MTEDRRARAGRRRPATRGSTPSLPSAPSSRRDGRRAMSVRTSVDRRRPGGARAARGCRARDAALLVGVALAPRRPTGAPQGREPAADGRVQDPRRLQHGRAALGGRAGRGRRHRQRRQPRAGGRVGGPGGAASRRRSSCRRARRWRRSRRLAATARRSSWPARTSTSRSRRPRDRAQTGATFVHAFDDPRVIAGQGTLGLELPTSFLRAGVDRGPRRRRRPRGRRSRSRSRAATRAPDRRRAGGRLRAVRRTRAGRGDDRRRHRRQAPRRADVPILQELGRRASWSSTTRRSPRRSSCCSSGRSSSSRAPARLRGGDRRRPDRRRRAASRCSRAATSTRRRSAP